MSTSETNSPDWLVKLQGESTTNEDILAAVPMMELAIVRGVMKLSQDGQLADGVNIPDVPVTLVGHKTLSRIVSGSVTSLLASCCSGHNADSVVDLAVNQNLRALFRLLFQVGWGKLDECAPTFMSAVDSAVENWFFDAKGSGVQEQAAFKSVQSASRWAILLGSIHYLSNSHTSLHVSAEAMRLLCVMLGWAGGATDDDSEENGGNSHEEQTIADVPSVVLNSTSVFKAPELMSTVMKLMVSFFNLYCGGFTSAPCCVLPNNSTKPKDNTLRTLVLLSEIVATMTLNSQVTPNINVSGVLQCRSGFINFFVEINQLVNRLKRSVVDSPSRRAVAELSPSGRSYLLSVTHTLEHLQFVLMAKVFFASTVVYTCCGLPEATIGEHWADHLYKASSFATLAEDHTAAAAMKTFSMKWMPKKNLVKVVKAVQLPLDDLQIEPLVVEQLLLSPLQQEGSTTSTVPLLSLVLLSHAIAGDEQIKAKLAHHQSKKPSNKKKAEKTESFKATFQSQFNASPYAKAMQAFEASVVELMLTNSTSAATMTRWTEVLFNAFDTARHFPNVLDSLDPVLVGEHVAAAVCGKHLEGHINADNIVVSLVESFGASWAATNMHPAVVAKAACNQCSPKNNGDSSSSGHTNVVTALFTVLNQQSGPVQVDIDAVDTVLGVVISFYTLPSSSLTDSSLLHLLVDCVVKTAVQSDDSLTNIANLKDVLQRVEACHTLDVTSASMWFQFSAFSAMMGIEGAASLCEKLFECSLETTETGGKKKKSKKPAQGSAFSVAVSVGLLTGFGYLVNVAGLESLKVLGVRAGNQLFFSTNSESQQPSGKKKAKTATSSSTEPPKFDEEKQLTLVLWCLSSETIAVGDLCDVLHDVSLGMQPALRIRAVETFLLQRDGSLDGEMVSAPLTRNYVDDVLRTVPTEANDSTLRLLALLVRLSGEQSTRIKDEAMNFLARVDLESTNVCAAIGSDVVSTLKKRKEYMLQKSLEELIAQEEEDRLRHIAAEAAQRRDEEQHIVSEKRAAEQKRKKEEARRQEREAAEKLAAEEAKRKEELHREREAQRQEEAAKAAAERAAKQAEEAKIAKALEEKRRAVVQREKALGDLGRELHKLGMPNSTVTTIIQSIRADSKLPSVRNVLEKHVSGCPREPVFENPPSHDSDVPLPPVEQPKKVDDGDAVQFADDDMFWAPTEATSPDTVHQQADEAGVSKSEVDSALLGWWTSRTYHERIAVLLDVFDYESKSESSVPVSAIVELVSGSDLAERGLPRNVHLLLDVLHGKGIVSLRKSSNGLVCSDAAITTFGRAYHREFACRELSFAFKKQKAMEELQRRLDAAKAAKQQLRKQREAERKRKRELQQKKALAAGSKHPSMMKQAPIVANETSEDDDEEEGEYLEQQLMQQIDLSALFGAPPPDISEQNDVAEPEAMVQEPEPREELWVTMGLDKLLSAAKETVLADAKASKERRKANRKKRRQQRGDTESDSDDEASAAITEEERAARAELRLRRRRERREARENAEASKDIGNRNAAEKKRDQQVKLALKEKRDNIPWYRQWTRRQIQYATMMIFIGTISLFFLYEILSQLFFGTKPAGSANLRRR